MEKNMWHRWKWNRDIRIIRILNYNLFTKNIYDKYIYIYINKYYIIIVGWKK